MNAKRLEEIEHRNYTLFRDETFNELNDKSFKFILFSSYKLAAVPAVLVQKTCAELSKNYGFNNFSMIQRIGDTGTPYWDEEFMKERIPHDVVKIMLAGSVKFVSNIRTILRNSGFDDKIIVEL